MTLGPDGYNVDVNHLRCLLEARPDEEDTTERVLPAETYEATYGAWEAARGHIAATWEVATDPANLDPKIPAVLERAIALVQDHYEHVLTVEQADSLVDRLRVPYPERMLRPVRQVLADGIPEEQVRALAELADDLGFESTTRPNPLPPINDDDIHLLCWIAITPDET